MKEAHIFLAVLASVVVVTASAKCESAAILLEKAIYAEETEGDLKKAMGLYEQIVKDDRANRPHVAQALYRLGVCHAKKGQEAKARELFQDLIARFPKQKAMVVATRGQLAKLAPPAGALKLNPAPWQDGEVMRLAIKMTSGAEIGTLIYFVGKATLDGRDLCRVESNRVGTVGDARQYTRVDADMDTFAPVFARTNSTPMGDIRAVYRDGEVEITPGAQPARKVKLSGITYDNEQALFLIRRLPLAKGYSASFPICAILGGGSLLTCKIKVTGTEKLSVPAGQFDCNKVILQCYVGEIKALEHTLWFSADESQCLVKYDAGAALMLLTDLDVRRPNVADPVEDEEYGYSFHLPEGWFAYRNPRSDGDRVTTSLLARGGDIWGRLMIAKKPTEGRSPRQIAEADAKSQKAMFKEYAIRAESWSAPELSGLPTARYVADYKDKGRGRAEYRTYLVGGSVVYSFVFRTDRTAFGEQKELLDSIVSSFRGE